MSDCEQVRFMAYNEGWRMAVNELADFIQQSPSLDPWAKEAVQRVVDEFLEGET